ncbi:MoaD/ThiS family protein [Rubritalea tangerina]|uniref:MoaD/ThiS family protein n=1 Tax=Rubritalea tangerina TaxID=430798 RepID=A0ABW4ZD90_9BACT
MRILLQGQLAVTSGTHAIEHQIDSPTTLESLILLTAQQLPEAARDLLITPQKQIRSSLFVAVDGTHQRDYSTQLSPNTSEIMLMPPMAGG